MNLTFQESISECHWLPMRMNRRFASNEASGVRAISRLAAKQLAVTHVSTGTVDIPLVVEHGSLLKYS